MHCQPDTSQVRISSIILENSILLPQLKIKIECHVLGYNITNLDNKGAESGLLMCFVLRQLLLTCPASTRPGEVTEQLKIRKV